jgi:hypothetical protein
MQVRMQKNPGDFFREKMSGYPDNYVAFSLKNNILCKF